MNFNKENGRQKSVVKKLKFEAGKVKKGYLQQKISKLNKKKLEM